VRDWLARLGLATVPSMLIGTSPPGVRLIAVAEPRPTRRTVLASPTRTGRRAWPRWSRPSATEARCSPERSATPRRYTQTSAIVGIHNKHVGRGPKSASTFHYGNVVVTLMHDVLTQAERTLAQSDHADAVTNIRQLFQATMEADFRAAIERLTPRRRLHQRQPHRSRHRRRAVHPRPAAQSRRASNAIRATVAVPTCASA
jgi:hypothetical protein